MMRYGRNRDWRTRQAYWWHWSDSLPNVYLWPWGEDTKDTPLWCSIFWDKSTSCTYETVQMDVFHFLNMLHSNKTAVAQIIWRMWFQDFDSTHKGFWYHILLSGVQRIDGKGKNSIKRILLIYSLRSSPHAGFSKAGVIYTGKRTLFSVMDPLPQGASKCENPLPTRNIW